MPIFEQQKKINIRLTGWHLQWGVNGFFKSYYLAVTNLLECFGKICSISSIINSKWTKLCFRVIWRGKNNMNFEFSKCWKTFHDFAIVCDQILHKRSYRICYEVKMKPKFWQRVGALKNWMRKSNFYFMSIKIYFITKSYSLHFKTKVSQESFILFKNSPSVSRKKFVWNCFGFSIAAIPTSTWARDTLLWVVKSEISAI